MNILKEADLIVNGERATDYGDSLAQCSKIAEFWSVILNIKVTPQQVCQCMIGLKLSRQMNKHKRDNLTDIAGYAEILNQVEQGQKRKSGGSNGSE